MLTLYAVYILVSVFLGFALAVPSHTCIVIVNLETIRKKGKLSPSDVIFMTKGMVNILLQSVLTIQGTLLIFSPEVLFIGEVFSVLRATGFLLSYFNFWLTAWLSAHYCTNITNLSCRFFIWIKTIVSNFLKQILFLTAVGMFPVGVLGILGLKAESDIQSSNNSTESFITYARFHVSLPYFVPAAFLGCILPFCLSLLCLLLTFSFLVRHVRRVKNNDSGSSRPNLQAHVTALRTIFFLLLMFTSFFMSQLLLFSKETLKNADPVSMASWILLILSPSAEAAVIFQASNKVRRIILRRFWTRSWRNSET